MRAPHTPRIVAPCPSHPRSQTTRLRAADPCRQARTRTAQWRAPCQCSLSSKMPTCCCRDPSCSRSRARRHRAPAQRAAAEAAAAAQTACQIRHQRPHCLRQCCCNPLLVAKDRSELGPTALESLLWGGLLRTICVRPLRVRPCHHSRAPFFIPWKPFSMVRPAA
jgi:hypothetical protein